MTADVPLREKLQVFAVALLLVNLCLRVMATRVDTYGELMHPDGHQYARMTELIREGRLTPETFTHGVGMPLLGLLGTYHGHRYLGPSMLLFALAALQLYLILRLFLAAGWALLALLLLLATTPMVEFYIGAPGNVISATLLLCLSSMVFRDRTLAARHGLGLGLLFGLDFAARYVDPLLLLPALLILLSRTLRREGGRRAGRVLAAFLAGSLPWLGLVLYFHQSVLGDYTHTPYMRKPVFPDRVGFGNEGIRTHLSSAHYYNDIPRNFYQLFVDPRAYALKEAIAGVDPLIVRMPYLVLFFVGLSYLFRRRPPWGVVAPYGAMAAAWFVFYLSIWPMTATELKFGCLRYLLGWYGLAGVVCIYGVHALAGDLAATPPGRRRRRAARVLGLGALPLLAIAALPPLDRWQIARGLVDRRAVTLAASSNPRLAGAALDGRLDTAWRTDGPARVGDWLELRLDRAVDVSELRFDLQRTADQDFPWRIAAFHDDGSGRWVPFDRLRTGRQNHIWRLSFPRRTLRAIRIEVLQPYREHPWTIHELSVRQ